MRTSVIERVYTNGSTAAHGIREVLRRHRNIAYHCGFCETRGLRITAMHTNNVGRMHANSSETEHGARYVLCSEHLVCSAQRPRSARINEDLRGFMSRCRRQRSRMHQRVHTDSGETEHGM